MSQERKRGVLSRGLGFHLALTAPAPGASASLSEKESLLWLLLGRAQYMHGMRAHCTVVQIPSRCPYTKVTGSCGLLQKDNGKFDFQLLQLTTQRLCLFQEHKGNKEKLC